MSRFIIVAFLLLVASTTSGQAITIGNLSIDEAGKLRQSLTGNIDDTTRIDILLTLAGYHFRKNFVLAEMDSAGMYLRMAREINARQISRKRSGRIMMLESFLQVQTGNKDSGKVLANRAIRELQNVKDEFQLFKAYMQLTLCYNTMGAEDTTAIKNIWDIQFQQAPARLRESQFTPYMLELLTFYHLHVSLYYETYLKIHFLGHMARYAKQLNASFYEFWARKEIADIHYQQNKLNLAINELLQIAKEQKEGNHGSLCYTYDLLAGFYTAAGNHEQALHYALETIKYVENAEDSFFLANFYSRIAAIYSKTGSVAEAVEWNLNLMRYQINRKELDHVYNLLLNIVNDLIRSGRAKEALDLVLDTKQKVPANLNMQKAAILKCLARCYDALNKKDMAERYFEELDKLVELRIQQKEIASEVSAHKYLADFYLSIGKLDKAEQYFLRVFVGDSTRESALSKNQFLYKLDSARGNYTSAWKHLQAYHALHDSIFNITKTKQIEELKISYATEQKDQQLALIEKDNQLQKNKLQQGAILRNISFAGLGLLVVIVGLLYNRYRLKQRTNRKLELQQEEIVRQNHSLEHLVQEKEWLLKEIHHRVKNNLQIVMSLLNTQSAYLENDALAAIKESQHRLQAMSLIHQKLYVEDNVASINMQLYIHELAGYLRDSYDSGRYIHYNLELESIDLDVAQAVPVGLILNESITNAIKYAFPDGHSGTIDIVMKTIPDGRVLLRIDDNGTGSLKGIGTGKKQSFGMNLIRGLVAQLDGTINVTSERGMHILVEFPLNKTMKAPAEQEMA